MPQRLLYFLFDQLYTRFAWSYDAVAWLVSGGLWYRWVAAALGYIQQGPVLEVGCGRGHLLPMVAAARWETIGLDLSPQMARAARGRHRAVLRSDALVLPFADATFGTLITTFPAPYVLTPDVQREFARVVTPGGHWLWVDGPMLGAAPSTLLARLLSRVAYPDEIAAHRDRLDADLTGGLWRIHSERPRIGNSTIGIRIAERREQAAAGRSS